MSGGVLECDIGNTCCKWRLRSDDGEIISRGVTSFEEHFSGLPFSAENVESVKVATVAKSEIKSCFQQVLEAAGVEPIFAKTTVYCQGVSNAYGERYADLGVDRWLAVIAAYQKVQGAVLVLDCGTALKADLVDATGQHLGGYITPGPNLMKESLLSGTGKVRFDEESFAYGLGFGQSTAAAVGGGITSALVGGAKEAVAQARRRIPEEFAILLTGGGAIKLDEYIKEDFELVPELVLDGLQWLIP